MDLPEKQLTKQGASQQSHAHPVGNSRISTALTVIGWKCSHMKVLLAFKHIPLDTLYL